MSDSFMIKLPIASCIIYVSVLLLSVFVSSSFSIIVLHLPLLMNDAKDESQHRLKTQLKHLEEELQNAKEESLSLLLTTSKEKELLEKKLTSMKQSVLQVEANNNNDDLGEEGPLIRDLLKRGITYTSRLMILNPLLKACSARLMKWK
ncbi:uncharacterized protein LOC113214302 isoform X2 [Frankliniella occidentalis]|uniref:Uncharacterized protein LOC113214302 isoform X2 n=1 Tax=Frankliniella occidentalis TaxID=133901 RepID=A0A9C6X5M8_FRAOC|nr:uncharacterized protein LOC113214302 isoform X2 [Frankliniella occidentalis]